MTTSLTIGLVQTTVSVLPEENLQTARQWIHKGADSGADLVVFPEMFMARPKPQVPLAQVAEPLDGPFISGLSALAEEHSIAIVCGVWESVKGDTHRAANVAIALGPDGKLLARYNKIHLFDALSVRESDQMKGGDSPPPLFTLRDMQLGLAICYDLRFPELFRDLATRGADAVILPSAWYAGVLKEDHWLTLLKARAIENTMYVCGANLCGAPFSARSAIFDPFGAAVAGAGEEEMLVCGHMTRARLVEVRAKLPTLTHVRKGLFNG
ncbi:MAG: carbon-nitrogen hydrolase family protein [Desulforhopalus sp.]